MAPRVLSDDEVFGPRTPATPTPATPAQPRVLSDEDVFGATPSSFADYAREIGTALLSAGPQAASSTLKGVSGARANDPTYPESQNPYELAMQGDPRFAENFTNPSMVTGPPIPLKDDPIWQGAQAIDVWGNKHLGPTPGWENSWTRDIAGGFGSLGVNIAAGLLNPAAGMLLAVVQGQGEAADNAARNGATPEQIATATRLGTGAGALDIMDVLLPHFGTPGKAAGFISKVGLPIVKAAIAEGGTEGLQQLIQNAIAKGIYKPDQDLTEGVARNAAVGAIVGGGAKGIQNTFTTSTPTGEATPEEIAIARATLTGQPSPLASDTKQPMSIDELMGLMGDMGIPTTDISSRGRVATPGASAPIEAPVAPPVATPAPVPTPDLADETARIRAGLDAKFPIPGATSVPEPSIPGTLTGTGGIIPEQDVFGPLYGPRPNPVADALNASNDAQYVPPPLEGEILPPDVRQMPKDEVPSPIIGFLNNELDQLSVPDKPMGFSDLLAQNNLRETTEGNPSDIPVGRLAKLLGAKIYGGPENAAAVSVKEILQNSFDGIKGLIDQIPGFKGKIDIRMEAKSSLPGFSPDDRTIAITDNGTGMTPEILGNQFLQIAGTVKNSKRASGGLGIAKMMFLLENKRLNVVTARDGKVSTMVTSGPEIFAALNKEGPNPQINTRPFSVKDRQVFPDGHGTYIELSIPKSFTDPSTGAETEIHFHPWDNYHDVLKNSPLFDNVDVTFNGKPLPIGSAFPVDQFTQFVNVNFDWGTARIYVSKDPVEVSNWGDNVHVLSNGLWQFSNLIRKGPQSREAIQRTFYLDINPKVKAEEAGYPFDLNRQRFSPTVQKEFDKIFNYIQQTYAQEAANLSVNNFGTIQFLDFDQDNKSVKATGERKLVPPKPQKTAASAISAGDSITVKDGKLIVNGREVPELTVKDLEEGHVINVARLKIPQSEIDPNSVILHDNTLVPATGTPLDQQANQDPFAQQPLIDLHDDGMPKIPLSQLAAQKFGGRFYEFVYLMGGSFRTLRDIIATYPVHETATSTGLKDYSGLKQEGIGISFDPEYRGVSIRIPFSASFLNVAIPVRNDPAGAAVGMVQTMVHELAHHVHRSEKGLAPVMQDLYTQLDLDPDFSFTQFKQRVVNIVSSYQDVFQFLNGAYQNGLVTTGGKRFADSSSNETRDGSVAGDVRESTPGEAGGYRLSDWRPLGQSIPGSGSRRPESLGGAGEARVQSNRDPSWGQNSNQRSLNLEPDPLTGEHTASGQSATQQQAELEPARQSIRSLFGGSTPRSVAAMGAHADRMNWFYKWMAGITQLADANPDFTPLLRYVEGLRAMHTDEAQIQDAAVRIGKDWRNLGSQSQNLTEFLHDLSNMVYLTPQEQAAGVERHPTQAEFTALIAKHQLSSEALKTFNKVKGLFDLFIKQVTAVQIEKATASMTDPSLILQKTLQIQQAGQKLANRPYFPFMNFGRHYVEVRNSAGDPIEFYTFERSGLRSAERVQMAALRKIQRQLDARGLGETAHEGILTEAADGFMGMPPQLLEAIRTNLGLSPAQIDALDKLILQGKSSMSFRSRFSNKKVLPGYSMDFQRAFAKYFFHGARYYARTKYGAALKGNIDEAQKAGGNKASRISEYMADHLQNSVLDAKSDHGILKGAIFLWAMGYVPAAAFQNLSQTPMITYPFLWAKFGNLTAINALTRAHANLNTFYKKGTYEPLVRAGNASFELKAIDYGIRSGRITETQAPELAGLAQGEGLIKGIGGNWASQKAVAFQEKAAWMFEMAEQYNRRLAYRAGLYIGMTKPGSKEVQLAVSKYQQEYLDLQTKGYTDAEAKAIVTAIHVVDQTQFVYARYARARFMRGKLPGTIFVFKQYMQSTLMMLSHNKSDVLPRAMLMWALLGGLAAMPGWDDWKEIIKAVARWQFGKDVDIERDLREAIMNYGGSAEGADLALHGFARKGFGVPAILDLMGSLFTGRPGRGLQSAHTPGQNVPFPVTDMSRALSMGNILPFELGKMINPEKPDVVIGQQTQRASGAAYSVAFNIYKAIFDNQHSLTDPKRYEKAIPRGLADLSRMFRSYSEGRERSTMGGPNTASTIVNYDVRDTEHLMELLAVGAGFQTERLTSRWDQIMTEVEANKFWDLHRKGLLTQYWTASKDKNPDEVETVRSLIQKFNEGLPDRARGYAISADTIRKSVQVRERELNARESGVPTRKAARPMSEYINSLFPDVPVDMRRVQ